MMRTLFGMGGRALLAAGLMVVMAAPLPAMADAYETGRIIYEQGILPSGQPLVGKRGNELMTGEAAACMTCHRRSGMGSVEGEILVAPITGTALFSATERVAATMDPRRGKLFNRPHSPYSDKAFADALSKGTHVSGREMHPLMPRYDLSQSDRAALMTYLAGLSSTWSPGVTAETIDFATIVTPGVSPVNKKALQEMVAAAVKGKNSSTRHGKRYMTSAAELMLQSGRRWSIDIWELTGAPETWGEQLSAFYRAKPVFAILSGLSESTWAPVEDFCEKESIPCLFPSLKTAPPAGDKRHPIYFTRGVDLEADVMAQYLRERPQGLPGRIVQLRSDSAASQAAAKRLSQRLPELGDRLETRVLAGQGAEALRQAIAGVGKNDSLVLWLMPAELEGLETLGAPRAGEVFFAGSLLDANPAHVPAGWRKASKLVYPYELPEKRRANLAYMKAWFKLKNITLVNEAVQSEIFFALNFANDTVSEMLNNLYRDYFIERTENMLAFREGSKAEQELRDRSQLGRVSYRGNNAEGAAVPAARELLELGRIEKGIGDQGGTTIYPRLSLATGQRFASKGAYIVNFTETYGDTIMNVTDWIVP